MQNVLLASGSCDDICSEVSDEDGNSQSHGDDKKSESSEDGEEANGDEDASDCDDQRVCRLFSLSFVNIYGNTEVSRLSDDGGQIKFGGGQHLLCTRFAFWCFDATMLCMYVCMVIYVHATACRLSRRRYDQL